MLIPLLLCLLAGAGVAPTLDEADDVAKFRRAFKSRKNAFASRISALNTLQGDSPAVAEALCDAYARLEAEAVPIEKERYQLLEKSRSGSIPQLRGQLDPIRMVQKELLIRVEALNGRDSVGWMLENVVGDKDMPMRLKLLVARMAPKLGEAAGPLFAGPLAKTKNPDELVVLLDSAARTGPAARPAADAVVKLLGHKSATVREKASWAAARIAIPQAIEPMIELLEQETGRTQERIASSLEILTRQKFGLTLDAWKRWLKEEGGPYVAGGVPLGGGEPTVLKPPEDSYYHGIPQDGQSIVYVVDVSGSMIVSMKSPQFQGGGRGPIAAPYGDESREDVSKRELIKALGSLSPDTMFNIVYYSGAAKRFAPKMLKATAGNLKKAQKFVEGLNCSGATNIYDALESAFALGGRAAYDHHYDSNVDTVFLLTDGKPMLPNGRLDDADRILDAARRWNALQRVVVHCIGLGEGEGTDNEFLATLAQEHGGQFVLRKAD